MTDPSIVVADTMLAIRDRYYAPSQLCPFADDMARRLSRISMGPMLEISADTGVLTQAVASATSAGLIIFATDPNMEAVEYASMKPGMARVTWQTADPRALPFPAETFGIVVNQFGVATLADRVQAFQESRRVMKAGGRFVFGVSGPMRHNPVAECLQDALQALFPSNPPVYLEHVLHGYAGNDSVDDDLTEAGFTDAIYTSVELSCMAGSARDLAIGYCLGTPLRLEIEARLPGDANRAIRAVTAGLERRFGPGPVKANMRAHVISASG